MHIVEASPEYLALLFVENDHPVIRGGMWIRHRNGQPPFEPQGFAVGASLHAEVYEGQWIVRCDGCRNSQFATRADKRFFCVNCLNGAHSGQWVEVVWPRHVDQVEAVLLARPNFANRNYVQGETVAELVEENRANRAPVPAGVIQISWTGAPTFITGAVLTATQLQILSDDLTDLDRRTTYASGGDGSTRSTASSAYVSLGTAAVSCLIGATGKALVTLYSSLQGDTVGMLVIMSYAISGAASYGPSDSDAITHQVANVLYSSRHGATHLADIGVGASGRACTFTAKYKVSGGGTGSYVDSRVTVCPLGA